MALTKTPICDFGKKADNFEIWSSKKQHELYLSELTESGRLSDIQFCLNGFPKFTFFNNLDDF